MLQSGCLGFTHLEKIAHQGPASRAWHVLDPAIPSDAFIVDNVDDDPGHWRKKRIYQCPRTE